MGTTFAILSGIVLFALLGKQYRGGPENLSTKPRKRSIRAKWKGTGAPSSEFKVPKYKVGQKVTIRSPHEKDQFEGKTVTITERIYYEVVEADPSGTLLPVPGAESWGYVVDLMFDGLPLNVAETSLVPEGGAAAGDDSYLCGDLPIDRILAPGSAGSGDAEAGYSWKKFGRALKKAAKWVYKNKYIRLAAVAAASTAMNIVAPGSGVALLAAVAIVDKATHKDKKIAAPALQKIQEIKDKADAGDPKAKEALSTLTLVREGQKEAVKEGRATEPEPLPDLKAAVQE
jgi:hypothetical protein